MHELTSVPPVQGYGILMGCPLWSSKNEDGTLNQDFIDRFFFFCLPSILAKQNADTLRDNCRLVIFTDVESYDRFWLMKRKVEQNHSIEVVIQIIPDEILAHLPKSPLNKYWLLGTVQQLLIQMAAHWRMGFHMLMPDHIYSEAYFKNLFRLAVEEGYEGLAQTGISADIEGVLPELEQYRQENGSLEIPDVDLGDMGYRHLHKQMIHNKMNDRDFSGDAFPLSHYVFWQGHDKLYLYCCHMNAAYLSPRMCKEAPIRLHNALDTELPYFMPNKVGLVTAEDGMTFIEVSDEKKLNHTSRVNFGQFAAQAWATVHFKDDYKPFFAQPNTVPIKPRTDGMDEEKILAQHAAIVKALDDCKPRVKAIMDEMDAKMREQYKQEQQVAIEAENSINFAPREAAD